MSLLTTYWRAVLGLGQWWDSSGGAGVTVSLGNDPTVSYLHLSDTAATVPPGCCDVI